MLVAQIGVKLTQTLRDHLKYRNIASMVFQALLHDGQKQVIGL